MVLNEGKHPVEENENCVKDDSVAGIEKEL